MLLCEAAAAVFLSLLVHSLSTFDPGILYRLVTHPLSAGKTNLPFIFFIFSGILFFGYQSFFLFHPGNLFNVLFGGGCRRQLSAPPPPSRPPPRPTPSSNLTTKTSPPPRPSPPAPERPPPPSPTPPRPSRGPTVIRDHAQARVDYVKRVTQPPPPPPSSQPPTPRETGDFISRSFFLFPFWAAAP